MHPKFHSTQDRSPRVFFLRATANICGITNYFNQIHFHNHRATCTVPNPFVLCFPASHALGRCRPAPAVCLPPALGPGDGRCPSKAQPLLRDRKMMGGGGLTPLGDCDGGGGRFFFGNPQRAKNTKKAGGFNRITASSQLPSGPIFFLPQARG